MSHKNNTTTTKNWSHCMFFRPRDGTPGMPEDLGPLSQAQNYIVSHGSPKPTKYPKITAAGIPRQWAELGLEPQLSTTWKASLDEDATSAMHFFGRRRASGVWFGDALQGSRPHNPTSRRAHMSQPQTFIHPCSLLMPQTLGPIYILDY